jgi:hypothetical protein
VNNIKEMSDIERENVMQAMIDNNDSQDDPKVGIFWYSDDEDDLFGVTKSFAGDLAFNHNGLKTVRTLHKDWWKKQEMRARSKGQTSSIFLRDYKQIKRGRIFETSDGKFRLMCGSWITDRIIDLVKDEFDLGNVPFEVIKDEHWDLGHGLSEDYFL